ncbi:MAG: Bug family tripartite tricarboxylate transporter substrate binding protein, partial [Noviherbaspirillum sp.]
YLGFTSMIQLPALMPKVPVNFTRDFAPVSLMALGTDLLVVSSRLPVNSVAELVALAKSKPGKLSIGSYGNGTSSHLHIELLKQRTGTDLIHVPYKGAAPMLNDLLGGQIDVAFVDQSTANGHLKSEKLRFLAMTGTDRFKPLPQLQTLGELGYAGFESKGFAGMFVATGTPAPVIERLSREIAAEIRGSDVGQRLISIGMQPVGSTPEELAALMERDAPRWARIIKDANVKID